MQEQAPYDPIAEMRRQIDGIDQLIIGAVRRRTSLAVAIGQEKLRRGLPTYVLGRHGEVLDNYRNAVPEDDPMTQQDAVELSELIQRIARDAQNRDRAVTEQEAVAARASLADLAGEAAAVLAVGDGGAVAPPTSL